MTLGQGYVVPQKGHVSNVESWRGNTMGPFLRMYLFQIASNWQKKLLVTSDGIR